ncbi:hypothetical protein FB567DRAFT_540778 [Paraphoma chrysanthemicola]|uniref:Uncharacterized protein n=1 Tax=Paraphoma chrysanthemicola TaxID=798071 RepID=A0A8K0QSS6_9PLEO|nr:hypothetical protein FB567DRAFT_540778 [Paraphoma chrysanthemicola]
MTRTAEGIVGRFSLLCKLLVVTNRTAADAPSLSRRPDLARASIASNLSLEEDFRMACGLTFTVFILYSTSHNPEVLSFLTSVVFEKLSHPSGGYDVHACLTSMRAHPIAWP